MIVCSGSLEVQSPLIGKRDLKKKFLKYLLGLKGFVRYCIFRKTCLFMSMGPCLVVIVQSCKVKEIFCNKLEHKIQ